MDTLPAFTYARPNPSAPTLLYLHGFLGCGDDWGAVADCLGDDFAHLTIDLPGHGRHPSDDLPDYSMETAARQIVSLLDHLGMEKVSLLGYSMGGRLGLYLAVMYPGRFERMVMESSSPGLKGNDERAERRRRDSQLADSLELQSFELFLTMWYGQQLFSSMNRSTERFAALIERRRRARPAHLARSLREMGTGAQPSLWNRLAELPMPILFIAGEKDRKFSLLAADMANLCPKSELAILADAGHNVHYEQPDRFLEEARRFLTQQE